MRIRRKKQIDAGPTLVEYMSAPEYADSRTLTEDLDRTMIESTILSVEGRARLVDCVLDGCYLRGPLLIECDPGMMAGCVGTLDPGDPWVGVARLTLVRSTMRGCQFDHAWIRPVPSVTMIDCTLSP